MPRESRVSSRRLALLPRGTDDSARALHVSLDETRDALGHVFSSVVVREVTRAGEGPRLVLEPGELNVLAAALRKAAAMIERSRAERPEANEPERV